MLFTPKGFGAVAVTRSTVKKPAHHLGLRNVNNYTIRMGIVKKTGLNDVELITACR